MTLKGSIDAVKKRIQAVSSSGYHNFEFYLWREVITKVILNST